MTIFYREAGDPSQATIVLLHRFPSSSYQFYEPIPRLADRFLVIAPDYPGMGFSETPAPIVLRPTFDDVATAIDAFLVEHAPVPVILYLHDFGGPTLCPDSLGALWSSARARFSMLLNPREVPPSCTTTPLPTKGENDGRGSENARRKDL